MAAFARDAHMAFRAVLGGIVDIRCVRYTGDEWFWFLPRTFRGEHRALSVKPGFPAFNKAPGANSR